jgi:hypothetical protein
MSHEDAKFRLKAAHFFGHVNQGVYLLGDREVFDQRSVEDGGALVGAGTEYPVQWPTLEMEPLNDDAIAWLEEERQRLIGDAGVMNPLENIPMKMDEFEKDYIPGLNVRRRDAKPHGAKSHVA